MNIGYARVSTLGQNPGPATAGPQKGGLQEDLPRAQERPSVAQSQVSEPLYSR